MKQFFTLLSKELIEHKVIFRIPLFLALFLVLNFILILYNSNDVSFNFKINGWEQFDNIQLSMGFGGVIGSINTLICGLVAVICFFAYMPKTLLKEKQEGSWNFWRSMPVSNVKTLGAKLVVGLIVIPAISVVLLVFADFCFMIVAKLLLSDALLQSSSINLHEMFMHIMSYINRMIVVSIGLLPIACVLLVLSQLTNHPLIILFAVTVMVKVLGYTINVLSGFSQFVSDWNNISVSALFDTNPWQELAIFSSIELGSILIITVGLFCYAVKLMSTELNN